MDNKKGGTMLKTNIQQGYLDKGIAMMLRTLFEKVDCYLQASQTNRNELWAYRKKEPSLFDGVKKVINSIFYEEWFNERIGIIKIHGKGEIDIEVENRFVFQEIESLIKESGKDKKYNFNFLILI